MPTAPLLRRRRPSGDLPAVAVFHRHHGEHAGFGFGLALLLVGEHARDHGTGVVAGDHHRFGRVDARRGDGARLGTGAEILSPCGEGPGTVAAAAALTGRTQSGSLPCLPSAFM